MKDIALFVETSRGFGRDMLRGIMRFARERGDWALFVQPGHVDEPHKLRSWQGDGVIARVRNPQSAKVLEEMNVPRVVSGPFEFRDRSGAPVGWPPTFDEREVVRMAFAHLRSWGHRTFGYFAPPAPALGSRGELLRAFATDGGFDFHALAARSEEEWRQGQSELRTWLAGVPKPIGILCGTDDHGRQLGEACARAGIRVPTEVAIIGIDNDELMCNLCTPPLTSVDTNAADLGYGAAMVLSELMEGKPFVGRPQVQPKGVVVRASTDAMACADEEVVRASTLMRANNGVVSVKDLANELGLSRSTINRRFRKTLGQSPGAEIRKQRISRARELLAQTGLSITAIARRCGFSRTSRFSESFRAAIGMTPTQYRRRLTTRPTGTDERDDDGP